jgi:mannose PTS system EIIA component
VLGVVIVAHGNLSQSYLDVAEQMLGKQRQVECVSYVIGDDMDKVREKIAKAINAVDSSRGVIIVADMFGGVPCNLAISVAQGQKVEVISGMNLTMLLKLFAARDALSTSEAAKEAKQVATKYITILSELLQEAGKP